MNLTVTKNDVAGNEIYTDKHIILSLQGNWAEEHIKVGDNINLIHTNAVSPLPNATEKNPLKIIISQQQCWCITIQLKFFWIASVFFYIILQKNIAVILIRIIKISHKISHSKTPYFCLFFVSSLA